MKVTEIFEVTEAEAKKLAENKESKVDLVGWLEDQEEQINAGKFWHQKVHWHKSYMFLQLWEIWITAVASLKLTRAK